MVLLPSAGIAAGGIVTLAPAPILGILFLATLTLPSIAVAFLGDSAAEHGVALLFLTFLIVLSVMWRQLHVEYWKALSIRSELERAKEAAEEATLAKGQFIASVSHELRTPLTSVIGALGMIEEYPPEGMPAEAMVLIDMAYRNGKRLSTLVNDILDFEKLDAHQMEFNFRPTELLSFLTHALDLNQIYAERHHVSFELEPPPHGTIIMTDENRLMQVMTNLLSNAAKHSPAGKKVLISVKNNAGMMRISVTDHGAGVPEDFRPHVFERFAQAESSNTRKAQGTGLGLAISKAIVEQMGGQIGFDSVVGQGTTFYFDLPLAEPSIPALG
jgi:signal transduction histidine kinase